MDTGLNLIPESVFSAPSRSVVVKRHSVKECGTSLLFSYRCFFDSRPLKVIGKYKMASGQKKSPFRKSSIVPVTFPTITFKD